LDRKSVSFLSLTRYSKIPLFQCSSDGVFD
jgi:hypothetical protein